jgi:hypothetical protein
LLAARQFRGRSAGQSLLDSFKTTKIATERISQLSAFQELFSLLSTTSEQGRRTILLRLVGDVDGIVALLAEALSAEWTPWIRWLVYLQELLDGHKTTELEPAVLAMIPRDPLNWLFDFDLLQQIADAAKRATRSAEESDPRPHRRSVLRSRSTTSWTTSSGKTSPQAGPARGDERRQRCQTLGRTSAGSWPMRPTSWASACAARTRREIGGDRWANDWKAEDVAAFCLGRARALVDVKPADLERRDPVGVCGDGLKPPPSVVIFGAGIAGLTAAHELAERGIEVTVVDAVKPRDDMPGMWSSVGGMARTQWTYASAWPPPSGSGSGSTSGTLFPGEHGYRLFPSFYRHLFDTMKRTPILGVDLDVTWQTHLPPGRHMNVRVSPEQLGIRPTAFDQLQATHKRCSPGVASSCRCVATRLAASRRP